jgi:hypothetical protein
MASRKGSYRSREFTELTPKRAMAHADGLLTKLEQVKAGMPGVDLSETEDAVRVERAKAAQRIGRKR